jgi:phosphatidylserine synthase
MVAAKKYDTTSPYTLANLITVLGFFSALYSIIMVQEAWVHYERSGYLALPVRSRH